MKEKVPIENERERNDYNCGHDMTIHRENPMTHTMFKRNHSNDIHPRVTKLKRQYSKVRFHLTK